MKIDIYFKPTFYNKWPAVKIYHNQSLLDDCEINSPITHLTYTVTPGSEKLNYLTLQLYNKSFGDNGIWDLDVTGSGRGELMLQLINIMFDDVSIDHLLTELKYNVTWTKNQLQYETEEFKSKYGNRNTNGTMSFNGAFTFEYSVPVYDFLIDAKYKQEHDTNRSYFSNNTETFHYESGLEIVQEIKNIIKQHE
jgi:hypothetical protein